MYEYVKTGCKHIPPSEQPLQFQSGYFLNKPRMFICGVPTKYLKNFGSWLHHRLKNKSVITRYNILYNF